LHPDVAGPEREEEFKKFQNSWQNGNIHEVLNTAIKENIINCLDDSTLKEMEKSFEIQKENLKKKKYNLRWGWHSSNKDSSARSRVLKFLGIEISKFEEWMKKRQNKQEIVEKESTEIAKQTLY
jgi:hypothetical protein